ncbi:SH3-domain GRB2-like 1a isoform 1 [Danio rerio]|uniref:Endophilin-A n=1 Tax=Danio rerio TaxID=7955 RepID=Q1MT71_DANRE|nr:SH3-domain GRB2-like 1a isoform 1 [Danio rerio]AAI53639.1 Sh3gl1a protein [Danio rerio]CAK04896.1 novel protein (zgc:56637) [Danio rerio]|eukprot:NP_001099076.1 SH3-domain GRB2-like 1a isoform 1 [Danio rerio]
MSVAGLKKQFYKASQLMSEKVGGAEGTKLDEDFKDLERKADITSKAISDVLCKTTEYLQPNPASRARLTMANTMSKMRGQVKSLGYPQAEGLLGECMLKYGRDMGEDTNFGGALVEMGEAMKRLAEVKDSLDIDVKQNFIDPFQTIVDKDLKDIQHHLKKLEGRRLDYDYKKKRQGKIADEELRMAMEKFEESRDAAETSMQNLLDTDVEQVSQLCALVESQLQFHKQSMQVLEELAGAMRERVNKAQSQPRQKRMPVSRPSIDYSDPEDSNGGWNPSAAAPPSYSSTAPSFNRASSRQKRNSADQPCCRALYDFEPENEGELGFNEGDVITLTNQIDDNWYEGSFRGQTGLFPCNYVEVMVPLR